MGRSSGTYTPTSGSWYPAVSGNAATFGDWNTLLADLSAALTQSLSQDGQTNPTANLPMAGFKHTGAGNASGSGQYIVWGQNCTLGTVTVSGMAGDGSGLTALSATALTTGTVPDARFPATLPAVSGVNLTSLNASNLGSGTVPDARFPATLPAGVTVPAAQLSGDIAQARLATNLNASGSAPMYVVRAWMVFNGTGTPARTSGGNFSTTITDNGVGDYTINFSTAMPTADYAVSITTNNNPTERVVGNISAATIGGTPTLKSTTQMRISFGGESARVDPSTIMVLVVC